MRNLTLNLVGQVSIRRDVLRHNLPYTVTKLLIQQLDFSVFTDENSIHSNEQNQNMHSL